MSTKRQGELLMALCAVMWSIGGILMKYIDESPFLIAGTRSFISGTVVLLYMMASRYKIKITKSSVSAGVCLCGCVTCFVIANKMTTAANAIVLQYIAPAFVLVITAVFLKQKLKKMEIGVVAVTFAGIMLFFMDELDLGSMAGNCIAIISGLFMGGMFIFNGSIHDMSEKMTGILLAHILTAVIGIPTGLITSGVSVTGIEIACILLLGIVQLGIPYIFYGKASSMISPLSCSLLGMIEPLLNPVWVALFYGEIPGLFALAGGIIVLGAVVYYNIWDEKNSKQLQNT